MIISCPQCDTSYNIPDDSVSQKGRKVRCSACAFRWIVEPSTAPPPSPDHEDAFGSLLDATHGDPNDLPAEFESDDIDGLPEHERDERKFAPSDRAQQALSAATSPRAIMGWLLLLLLIGTLATFVLARKQIASVVPSMTGVYETLGLDISTPLTLDLEDVTSEEIADGGETVIIVNGIIVNDGPSAQMVPPIVVSLLDSERIALQSNIATPLETMLEAGDRTHFEAQFPQPPAQAAQFSVAFQQNRDSDRADTTGELIEAVDN